MTEKEIRKLKRAELLEIMVEQGKQIDNLRTENEELKKKLSDRMICIDKAGTIAEASLQLSGIFEAAQAASAQYMENIQYLSERQESICSKMEQETREKCFKMEQEAQEKSSQMERSAEEKCSAMIKEATEAVEERWKELSRRLEAFYDAHKGLRELMTSVGNIKFD